MVFFFFLKSNNSFPSKQWKKKKWRWVRLWWERASLFLVLELLGPSFSGISAMRPLFPQIRLRCPFFFLGPELLGIHLIFCLIGCAESCSVLRIRWPIDSFCFVGSLTLFRGKPIGIAMTTLPHGYASRRFFRLMCRRAALLEKTEPGLLCCPSSELTIHGRALAEKCSTGELHGTALIVRHRLYRRLIRSRASPPVPDLTCSCILCPACTPD